MKHVLEKQEMSICDFGWLGRNSHLGIWCPLAVCYGEHEKQLLSS